MWANDRDSRNAHVITRNVGAQLQDDEPQLASPLPGLSAAVLELSSRQGDASGAHGSSAQQQRDDQNDANAASGHDAAAAHFVDRAAHDPAFSYMERELGEVAHSSGDRPECDQSPASLFYGPSDAEGAEECELPAGLWRPPAGAQRAYVTHADGAGRSFACAPAICWAGEAGGPQECRVDSRDC